MTTDYIEIICGMWRGVMPLNWFEDCWLAFRSSLHNSIEFLGSIALHDCPAVAAGRRRAGPLLCPACCYLSECLGILDTLWYCDTVIQSCWLTTVLVTSAQWYTIIYQELIIHIYFWNKYIFIHIYKYIFIFGIIILNVMTRLTQQEDIDKR